MAMTDKIFTAARAASALQQEGLLDGRATFPEARGWSRRTAISIPFPGVFWEPVWTIATLAGGELFVAVKGEQMDGRRFRRGRVAVGPLGSDPPGGSADDLLEVDAGAGVLLSGDPEAALAALAGNWRAGFDIPVVGVTGTNGKTTTKDFITALLSAAGPTCATAGNLNNRLGLPITLLRLRETDRFAVIEMGASAVGHIAHLAGLARPTVAIITNAGPAHLAEFGSVEGVIQGKGEILDLLPARGGPSSTRTVRAIAAGWTGHLAR